MRRISGLVSWSISITACLLGKNLLGEGVLTFLSLDGPPHAGKFAEIPTKVIKDKITAVKDLITNTLAVFNNESEGL